MLPVEVAPAQAPAGLHALRIDPHNAGGAIAAVDRTVRHDARRTPGLCLRGHLKMRGVVSPIPATPYSICSESREMDAVPVFLRRKDAAQYLGRKIWIFI